MRGRYQETMNNCSKTLISQPITGLEFSEEEIQAAALQHRLLSIELEMTYACNLRCRYCYSSAGKALKDELTFEQIQDILEQAALLGARKVVVLGGGEPLVYERLRELVEFSTTIGLKIEIFTNGTLIDDAMAAFFYSNHVSVIVKRNSLHAEIQDKLAGVSGTFSRIQKSIKALRSVGYPDENHALGIQTIICKANLSEIPNIWMWAREHNIHPYFECMTIQGRARQNSELYVKPADLHRMFQILCSIDRMEYGYNWVPVPPLVGSTCKRHLYSLVIRPNGDVCPCVGVDKPVGNIRHDRLDNLLKNDPLLDDLRNIYDRIKGTCRTCNFNGQCYGCRGNAFQLTGDHLASDPSCWIAQEENIQCQKSF